MDRPIDNRTAVVRSRIRLAGTSLAALVLATSTGCLALGVPSERLHDPIDQGGLFGEWRVNPSRTIAATTAELVHEGGALVPAHSIGGPHACHDVGMLELPPGASALDLNANGVSVGKPEKPPEVPWPKYHPVPTRPVFGVLSE